jgi:Zn-dependent peptidase ImmA (M78 family)
MTKKAVAEALSVSQRTVIRWEGGDPPPPPESIARLAGLLSFPEGFFFGPDVDETKVRDRPASFRSMSAMTARDREAALAAGTFAFMLDDWIEQRFSLPPADLLDLRGDEPEAAARSLRQHWGLGERPIRNMVHLLEAKGVRVFSMNENTKTVDAFSLWRREKPYVFLNQHKTPERGRFDAAHELAHLVLHRHGGGPAGREAEEQADRFASSFLMPSADVLAVLPRVQSLNEIIQAKKRWRVSVSALNYQLHKLMVTTSWQYRTFCIQLTERGYRECEPYGIERETSAVWQKVLDALRSEGTTKRDIADALMLPVAEIENLVFKLANMMSLEGGRATEGGRSRARLALVTTNGITNE